MDTVLTSKTGVVSVSILQGSETTGGTALDTKIDRTDASLYRLLVDAITDYAVYMLDPDGIVASWNAGAERIKGYKSSEIIGRHFSQFYTEPDRLAEVPRHALETSLREGKYETEGWRIRKDGTQFWAHVVIDPILAPDGQTLGFAKITRDLTERKHAETALKRSEEQFRLLVQSVTDYSIYMLDPQGYVSSWNLGAQRIKGYKPEEIIGEHFSRFYTEEDRQSGYPQRALDMAAREGRFEKEGWRVRKDGSRFLASVVIDPIFQDDGSLIGFAKVTRDITERREAQKALEQARETLFQSQKMDAIGQLTGGIAHDFNNLLMVVLSSLEMVKKRLPADAQVIPLIDNAIQGAQRGSALTQRMLAFARRQELAAVPVDVPVLVRDMRDLLQRSLGPSIPIELRFPLSISDALADANQLELALLNLAVNARDAMPNGGSIVIAAREENVGEGHLTKLAVGRYLVLSLTDTGEGMDEETLEKAMEPFFTTKGVGKGTGLGLSMVHGMAAQSGGRLTLRSRLGEGTTAEIWLPVVQGEAPSGKVHILSNPTSPPEMRALLVVAVDDDPLVLMNTQAMLEDLGHTVLPAHSARQAQELLAANEADLVITDQAMPKVTGLQLAEAIRRQRPDLPIILATGYADLPAGSLSEFVKLPKPFAQDDLARAVVDAMRAAKGPARLLQFPPL